MHKGVLLGALALHACVVGYALMAQRQAAPVREAPQALQVSVLPDTSAPLPALPSPQPEPPRASPQKPLTKPADTRPSSPMPAPAVAPPIKPAPNSAANPAAIITPPAANSPAAASPQAEAPPSPPVPSIPRPSQDISTAPAAPAPPQRQAVSIDASYAASNPIPPYPPLARRLGEQGTVVLRILVAADGTARDIQIKKSSGSPTLDRSAEITIKQWRFNPAKIDGKPVDEWYETRWTFKLEG